MLSPRIVMQPPRLLPHWRSEEPVTTTDRLANIRQRRSAAVLIYVKLREVCGLRDLMPSSFRPRCIAVSRIGPRGLGRAGAL